MFTMVVRGDELFDKVKKEFTTTGDVVLELEHSLVSLSKWESIYEKPFLSTAERTDNEVMGYVQAMILTPDYPSDTLDRLTQADLDRIHAYIDAKMTATWFNDTQPQPQSTEAITSELIYYWMTTFNIPIQCENWHLNRLFTLIRICTLKNSKPKKMSRAEIAQRNRELNARRRAQLGTKG